ncbi:MAG: Dabb family protein [Flavobacteriaceae bacterium]
MKTMNKLVLVIIFLGFVTGLNAQENIKRKILHHVLLIQWSQDHDKQIKNEVINLFTELPSKIDGLENFSIKKVEKSSGDFHSMLVFEFSSKEALAAYDEHPDHEKVKTLAPQIISGYAEYDYWDL